MPKKTLLWKLCCAVAIALSSLAFSPWVLSMGDHTPELLGLPRTLWLGILIAFALVAVTLIGGVVHPANKLERTQSQDEQC